MALEAFAIAQTMASPGNKAIMLEIAATYDHFAELAEKQVPTKTRLADSFKREKT